MTKAPAGGENEITREAMREAARTNKHVSTILAAMLRKARASEDKASHGTFTAPCRTINSNQVGSRPSFSLAAVARSCCAEVSGAAVGPPAAGLTS